MQIPTGNGILYKGLILTAQVIAAMRAFAVLESCVDVEAVERATSFQLAGLIDLWYPGGVRRFVEEVR